jgi:hypothetical protein
MLIIVDKLYTAKSSKQKTKIEQKRYFTYVVGRNAEINLTN